MSIQRSKNQNHYVTLQKGTTVSTDIRFQYGGFTAGGRSAPLPRNVEACVLASRPDGLRHFVAVDFEGHQLYAWVNDEQVQELTHDSLKTG